MHFSVKHEQDPSRGRRGGSPTVCLVGGTRPEGLKLGPVATAMTERDRLRPLVVASGQHPTMFRQAVDVFELTLDVALTRRRTNGGQAELMGFLTTGLDAVLAEHRPAAVVVQGDTTTALAAALTAFWHHIPVVHLEAGLRSWDLNAPFPEEGNRKLIGQIASLHLAPTPAAVRNLGAEGIVGPQVLQIGNTIVDAALSLSTRPGDYSDRRLGPIEHRAATGRRRIVLVTVHRRESWGGPLGRVLDAVAELVRSAPDVEVVLPAHPNPLVRDEVGRRLAAVDRVTITDPLPYPDLMRLLRHAVLVMSDSGGLQEEVASFGVPILILRDVTERMEAVEAGFATLVGTDDRAIFEAATQILAGTHPSSTASGRRHNPFGDGLAGYRAEQAIAWYLGLETAPPEQFDPTRSATLMEAAQ